MIKVVATLKAVDTCNGKRLTGRVDKPVKKGEQIVLRRVGEHYELLIDTGNTNRYEREQLYAFVDLEQLGVQVEDTKKKAPQDGDAHRAASANKARRTAARK